MEDIDLRRDFLTYIDTLDKLAQDIGDKPERGDELEEAVRKVYGIIDEVNAKPDDDRDTDLLKTIQPCMDSWLETGTAVPLDLTVKERIKAWRKKYLSPEYLRASQAGKTQKRAAKEQDKEDALAVAAQCWEERPNLYPAQVAEMILTYRRVAWRCGEPAPKTLRDWIAPKCPAPKTGRPPKISR